MRARRVSSRPQQGKGRAAVQRSPRPLRWPTRASRRRWLRRLRRTPAAWRLLLGVLLLAVAALAVNGVYQVLRKPTELFFPVSGVLAKTPQETWREYGPAFPPLCHARHRSGAPGGARAGRGLRQPARAHLLALVMGAKALRSLPPGFERRRHVPDHRWHLRRGAALLHPPPCAGARRSVERLALVLVQQPVPACRAARCNRADSAYLDLKVNAILAARATRAQVPCRDGTWPRWCTCAGRAPPRSTRSVAFASRTGSVAAHTTRASTCGASMRCAAYSRGLPARIPGTLAAALQ